MGIGCKPVIRRGYMGAPLLYTEIYSAGVALMPSLNRISVPMRIVDAASRKFQSSSFQSPNAQTNGDRSGNNGSAQVGYSYLQKLSSQRGVLIYAASGPLDSEAAVAFLGNAE